MIKRKVIRIDEALCNGCGNCMIACAEGAIQMVNGKAHVVSDKFCDGLGACIGECPTNVLTIEERVAEEFDEKAAKEHIIQSRLDKSELSTEKPVEEAKKQLPLTPCSISVDKTIHPGPGRHKGKLGPSSQLSSWPIQMRLAHADAPYFKDAKLLIAADCSAFASPSISDLIKGRIVLIGCPKLDETGPFVERLSEILTQNEVKDITILHMEVPCCINLVRLVVEAMKKSGKDIALNLFVCIIDGSVVNEEKTR
jgi:Pyruvate/2-oxoacid:ferredoxin oxidoreductase delta subunit